MNLFMVVRESVVLGFDPANSDIYIGRLDETGKEARFVKKLPGNRPQFAADCRMNEKITHHVSQADLAFDGPGTETFFHARVNKSGGMDATWIYDGGGNHIDGGFSVSINGNMEVTVQPVWGADYDAKKKELRAM